MAWYHSAFKKPAQIAAAIGGGLWGAMKGAAIGAGIGIAGAVVGAVVGIGAAITGGLGGGGNGGVGDDLGLSDGDNKKAGWAIAGLVVAGIAIGAAFVFGGWIPAAIAAGACIGTCALGGAIYYGVKEGYEAYQKVGETFELAEAADLTKNSQKKPSKKGPEHRVENAPAPPQQAQTQQTAADKQIERLNGLLQQPHAEKVHAEAHADPTLHGHNAIQHHRHHHRTHSSSNEPSAKASAPSSTSAFVTTDKTQHDALKQLTTNLSKELQNNNPSNLIQAMKPIDQGVQIQLKSTTPTTGAAQQGATITASKSQAQDGTSNMQYTVDPAHMDDPATIKWLCTKAVESASNGTSFDMNKTPEHVRDLYFAALSEAKNTAGRNDIQIIPPTPTQRQAMR